MAGKKKQSKMIDLKLIKGGKLLMMMAMVVIY